MRLSDIIIIAIVILRIREFFSPALADGLLLEFEWQQVTRTFLSNAVV